MATTQTFEEAVQEFIELSRELVGKETAESMPPAPPAPYDQDGPPYENPIRFDQRNIRNYMRTIGDDNPLYNDPEYARGTRYGCLIAPGPILSQIRGITAHGVQYGGEGKKRREGYPVANYFSGAAWEFFDTVKVGSKFRSSMVTRDLFTKQGSRGNLIFFISELMYWDYHGDLAGKCYGTLIMVPIEAMGASRSMNVDKVGSQLLYERGTQSYSAEDLQPIVEDMERMRPLRRGAETLYWEDVEVGERLGPVVVPPWTLQDLEAPNMVGSCVLHIAKGDPGDELAFEPVFNRFKKRGEGHHVTHPATRWPWSASAEHSDPLMAAFRALPGPFDGGVQRTQIPHRLLSDWMGDEGFVRRQQTAIRKPVFYSDTTYYTGEVVKKFKEVQEGEQGPGAVPGKREYHAVGIRLEGKNQVGEVSTPGTACIYLPSRQDGPVQLPIPHKARPDFVPYDVFYRDWF